MVMARTRVINTIVALDVGERRIGVAVAQTAAGIAHPEMVLERHETVIKDIQELLKHHQAAVLVVGLPRGMEGQETAQTRSTQQLIDQLTTTLSVPVYAQDESVTSKLAETELKNRGKPYAKGDIDALAAAYILQDFLDSHPEVR